MTPSKVVVPRMHANSMNQLPCINTLNKTPTVKIMHQLNSLLQELHNSSELRPYLRCPRNVHSQPTFSYLKQQSGFEPQHLTENIVTSVDHTAFTISNDLYQNQRLLMHLKNYHKMHSVYFMNIFKSVLKNTVRFIPDFPVVSDDVFHRLSNRIYKKYFWFVTYSQIMASYRALKVKNAVFWLNKI